MTGGTRGPGYLYLEFKRQESDTWLTVGMGIRARRGKPLDKWYFSLSDGRRVGRDFLLYKEIGEKVTLSKKELENRTPAADRCLTARRLHGICQPPDLRV